MRNLGTDTAAAIVEARTGRPFADLNDLVRRVQPRIPLQALAALATGGAFECFGLDRRRALWAVGLAHQGGAELRTLEHGKRVIIGGLVTHRQRPPTAGGVVFLNLEDETGMVNVICPPAVFLRSRRTVLEASALLVEGRLERSDGATNLVATRFTPLRVAASARSRDFR